MLMLLNQYERLAFIIRFRIFWFSILLGSLIFSHMGVGGYLLLVVLEVAFSFDNAVINNQVSGGMSQIWRKVF